MRTPRQIRARRKTVKALWGYPDKAIAAFTHYSPRTIRQDLRAMGIWKYATPECIKANGGKTADAFIRVAA